MSYNYVMIKCPNDHSYVTTMDYNGELGTDEKFCDKCGELNSIIQEDDIDNPDIFILIAEDMLESANYHNIENVPFALYYAIEKYVPKENKRDVAKKILDIFKRVIS